MTPWPCPQLSPGASRIQTHGADVSPLIPASHQHGGATIPQLVTGLGQEHWALWLLVWMERLPWSRSRHMDQEHTLGHALAVKFLLPSISQPTEHHQGHQGAFPEFDLCQLPWVKGSSWRAASPGWDTWEQGGFGTP